MNEPRKRVTIFDVADRAGVAISTVSRVLNESPLVRQETRDKVLGIIRDLNFRPSRTARSLAQKDGVKTLAVVVPSFTTRFYSALLKGVKSGLGAEHIDMLVYDVGFDDPGSLLLGFLKRGAVDGVLLGHSAYNDKLEEHLRVLHTNVVLIGAQSSFFDCFHWNNASGVRSAVGHLIENGHRKIAMIAAQSLNVNASVRLETYRKTIEEAGMDYDESLVRVGKTTDFAGYSEEAGYEAMKALLTSGAEFTAVFAASDVQAIGASKAIREAGLRIPEDIALVGYDNIKTTAYIGLSSVDQHMNDVGRQAAKLLVRRMAGEEVDHSDNLIVPNLIVRESSDYQRT